QWAEMKARVCSSAWARLVVEALTASTSPESLWCFLFQSSMASRTESGWWTARAGPWAMRFRSLSVTRVAISRTTQVLGSRPDISMSIHTRLFCDGSGIGIPQVGDRLLEIIGPGGQKNSPLLRVG